MLVQGEVETLPEINDSSEISKVNKKLKKKVSLVLPKLKVGADGSSLKKKSRGNKPKASSTPAKAIHEDANDGGEVEPTKEEVSDIFFLRFFLGYISIPPGLAGDH